ncbi:hypothetical protein [Roseibium album]|uniref:hypothetical protein n=1 Tax=Roseibium album TaxID=311410 RepID=UPI00391D1130
MHEIIGLVADTIGIVLGLAVFVGAARKFLSNSKDDDDDKPDDQDKSDPSSHRDAAE